jgi:hypothetical protein
LAGERGRKGQPVFLYTTNRLGKKIQISKSESRDTFKNENQELNAEARRTQRKEAE